MVNRIFMLQLLGAFYIGSNSILLLAATIIQVY